MPPFNLQFPPSLMTRLTAFTLLLAIALPGKAEAVILFDAVAGTTPNAQGWTYLTNPVFGSAATQTVAGGVLSLDTRADITEQAGYFSKFPVLNPGHPNHPILDLSSTAYSIVITMQQSGGQDLPDTDPRALDQRNRGGFALIAISEDLRGIELQFQSDRIISLDDANESFPIGEVVDFDTTISLATFDLRMSDSGYQLLADGTPILAGDLRDYSAIAPDGVTEFVYQTPSFLFFGDNTGRGAAETRLGSFSVTAVPEPGTFLVASLLTSIVTVRRLRRRPLPDPTGDRSGRESEGEQPVGS